MINEARNPEIAYLLAAAGMDFLLVDTEHASPDTETLQNITRAAKSAGLVPLARVTDNEYFIIARILDMGVMGVMVPRVDTKEEAERAVAAVKYPPSGAEALGCDPSSPTTSRQPSARPSNGRMRTRSSSFRWESGQAVENLEKITGVPGVDVSLVGLNDLSISLGVPGEFDHPRVEEA